MLFNLFNDSIFGGTMKRDDGSVSLQRFLKVDSDMIRHLGGDVHHTQLEEYCAKLRSMLGLHIQPLGSRLILNWVSSQPNQINVRLQNELQPLLRHLHRLTGGGAKVVVEFTLNYKLFEQRSSLRFKTKEMVITVPEISKENLFKELTKPNEAFCVDTVVHDGLKRILDWTDLRLTANAQFVVVDTFIRDEDNSVEQLMNKCKYIRAQRLHSDASIVAADGTVFEFNKCFLTPHSEVLSAMFDGDFQEARSSQVKWDTVSADCVQALLDFIYTFDLGKTLNSSALAVQLFQLAHSYAIQPLEEKLMEMFLLRGAQWFDISAALDLFSLASKIDADELKTKIVQGFISRKEEFLKSEEFKKLAMDDWETATHLISLALEMK